MPAVVLQVPGHAALARAPSPSPCSGHTGGLPHPDPLLGPPSAAQRCLPHAHPGGEQAPAPCLHGQAESAPVRIECALRSEAAADPADAGCNFTHCAITGLFTCML